MKWVKVTKEDVNRFISSLDPDEWIYIFEDDEYRHKASPNNSNVTVCQKPINKDSSEGTKQELGSFDFCSTCLQASIVLDKISKEA